MVLIFMDLFCLVVLVISKWGILARFIIKILFEMVLFNVIGRFIFVCLNLFDISIFCMEIICFLWLGILILMVFCLGIGVMMWIFSVVRFRVILFFRFLILEI